MTEKQAFEGLINAIILQALKDTRSNRAEIKNDAMYFFHSEWYTALTDIDADYLLNKFNEKKGVTIK